MDSVKNNLIDMVIRADFSVETDFKETLRKKLFENKSRKSGILQFQRLSDDALNMVSAAGDQSLLVQKEQGLNAGQEHK